MKRKKKGLLCPLKGISCTTNQVERKYRHKFKVSLKSTLQLKRGPRVWKISLALNDLLRSPQWQFRHEEFCDCHFLPSSLVPPILPGGSCLLEPGSPSNFTLGLFSILTTLSPHVLQDSGMHASCFPHTQQH